MEDWEIEKKKHVQKPLGLFIYATGVGLHLRLFTANDSHKSENCPSSNNN